MKKPLHHLNCLLFIISVLLFHSCTGYGPEPEPDGSWSKADKESYNQVLDVQNQIGEDLDGWFQSMDSLNAIQTAQDAFLKSKYVSSATINSQGISVQYKNGMRGGLFLDPKDDKSEIGEPLQDYPPAESGDRLKSLVNQKKMILINPHYFERSYYTDQIYSVTGSKLGKVGMELSTFYKNAEATVDRFTELSGYGIIQIYSHGWAWPKDKNITDVYLLTGETANDATSEKYWNEVKSGNIPVVKIAGPNKYLVAPRFIMEHNDFSKDTVLFFGGFCYSFLGDWPDLEKSFADGAYMGFDWSVYTFKNANWSVNSIARLCDTSLTSPMTLEGWMSGVDPEKSYWNQKDSRTVHIQYVGDGKLTLWDDVKVTLKALSSDGTPVSNPGKAGEPYSFKCNVITNISPLEYVWDIGDGSSPATTQGNQVNITWSDDGDYELSVKVNDKNTAKMIGTAKLNVTIGKPDNDALEFLQSCTIASCSIGPNGALNYSPAKRGGPLDIFMSTKNLTWAGLSFSGSNSIGNLGSFCTLEGSVSSDGQKVSYVAHLEYISEITNKIFQNFTVTVTNLPLTSIDMDGSTSEKPWAKYGWNYTGHDFQKYVSGIEGYEVDGEKTYNVTGVDWDLVSKLSFGFWKERN